ncbi:transcriptional regulator GlxA family with amidase domain [Rhizobium rosettiformans]|uniref:Helix-turn-helix domain-containing protein n=2 Tax=Rhizobium rosettiformans TaxID=1368430 RepID=A0A4S8PYN8_9HYPH|nr:helix-turn-helix domain-containing protein [Rhizobium rosettiformans]MBB5276119.1 transcriptional regulator GlxA family with amidase domain [Rhizobium rosettiformans]THV36760.1 helix-turn-helix domain-containing protein [Rhizobium rosettiformans W3]
MDVIPVFILVPPDTLLIDIAGPLEVLRYANGEQDRVRFDYRYISAKPRQQTSIRLVLDGLDPLPETLPEQAILVISGSLTVGIDEIARDAELKELKRWLARTVRPDTRLVTICSGALLAAAAGLMEGYQCTTHAECLDELRSLAPTASVLENRLYVEDGNRFSSAGISTGIDLMLHLVSRFASPQAALAAARKMVIYLRRSGQDPQLSPWLSGRNHIHPAIHRAQDAIMADPARDWSLPGLAGIAHLSERHLSRLFREHVGQSVVDYVNLMRVTLAQELLKQSRLDMESLALRSGFASSRHMRRVFAQHHGLSPSAFRKTGD